VQDAAGNWSNVLAANLVVFDPATTTVVTAGGNNAVQPSTGYGDTLPGLVDSNQKDKASFTLSAQYVGGAIAPGSDATFSYSTGKKCNSLTPNNCHDFSLDATQIDWLIISGTNNSKATVQGVATVTVDGVTTTQTFVVEVTDGDKAGGTADHYTLRVYAPVSTSTQTHHCT
jgi:hypothetical protein